ncbi:MAG: hypothetical protein KJO36_08510 [Acidimicrobiia bacterium]|nr:hypothetical protein [Acidimicrobiia bacterium]MBT8251127.1 hypothetical protein [Acidimicrobiia bacterium]NNC43778.1 hypothetical protein [Acidimicrobiia bacterium]NND14560.1 hypothetical protein [Acidimicrobiia bacterium]NNL29291.1 hypothetical protein [Acidimicrobiia bacterium]
MTEHPEPTTLQEWAAGDHEELTGHIETCDRCQSVLESTTSLSRQERTALDRVTSPPPGMIARIGQSILERRDRGSEWEAFAELFGVAWSMFDVLANDPDLEVIDDD